jgi:hypothetical protein
MLEARGTAPPVGPAVCLGFYSSAISIFVLELPNEKAKTAVFTVGHMSIRSLVMTPDCPAQFFQAVYAIITLRTHQLFNLRKAFRHLASAHFSLSSSQSVLLGGFFERGNASFDVL